MNQLAPALASKSESRILGQESESASDGLSGCALWISMAGGASEMIIVQGFLLFLLIFLNCKKNNSNCSSYNSKISIKISIKKGFADFAKSGTIHSVNVVPIILHELYCYGNKDQGQWPAAAGGARHRYLLLLAYLRQYRYRQRNGYRYCGSSLKHCSS